MNITNISSYAQVRFEDFPEQSSAEQDFQILKELVFNCVEDAADFLKKTPSLEPLREVIGAYQKSSKEGYSQDLLLGIFVLFGIKPALAIEPLFEGFLDNITEVDRNRNEVIGQLQKLESLNKNCHLISNSDFHCTSYLVNEEPLPVFDPRKYIEKEHFDKYQGSIYQAIEANFYVKDTRKEMVRESVESGQFSTYLLGYGPTWEAFIGKNWEEWEDQQEMLVQSIYSDEHYRQLGVNKGYIPTQPAEDDDHELNLPVHLEFICDNASLSSEYLRELIEYRTKIEKLISFSSFH